MQSKLQWKIQKETRKEQMERLGKRAIGRYCCCEKISKTYLGTRDVKSVCFDFLWIKSAIKILRDQAGKRLNGMCTVQLPAKTLWFLRPCTCNPKKDSTFHTHLTSQRAQLQGCTFNLIKRFNGRTFFENPGNIVFFYQCCRCAHT